MKIREFVKKFHLYDISEDDLIITLSSGNACNELLNDSNINRYKLEIGTVLIKLYLMIVAEKTKFNIVEFSNLIFLNYIDEIYKVLDFDDIVLLGTEKNRTVKQKIVKQFIGLLYTVGGYVRVAELLDSLKIDIVSLIEINYTIVFNTLFPNKKFIVNYSNYCSNDSMNYMAEITIENKLYTGIGSSKKYALDKCYMSYIRDNFIQAEIYEFLNLVKKKNGKLNLKSIELPKTVIEFMKVYKDDSFSVSEYYKILTHKSFSNVYVAKSNSEWSILGSQVYLLYLMETSQKIDIKNAVPSDLINYYYKFDFIYELMIKIYEINKYILVTPGININENITKDSIYALIYLDFMKNKESKLKKYLIDKIAFDFDWIKCKSHQSTNMYNEMMSIFKMPKVNYNITTLKTGVEPEFGGLVDIQLNKYIYCCKEKSNAINELKRKLLEPMAYDLYEVIDFLSHNNAYNVNKDLLFWYLLQLIENKEKVYQHIKRYNLFGLKDKDSFNNRFKSVTIKLKKIVSKELYCNLLISIKEVFSNYNYCFDDGIYIEAYIDNQVYGESLDFYQHKYLEEKCKKNQKIAIEKWDILTNKLKAEIIDLNQNILPKVPTLDSELTNMVIKNVSPSNYQYLSINDVIYHIIKNKKTNYIVSDLNSSVDKIINSVIEVFKPNKIIISVGYFYDSGYRYLSHNIEKFLSYGNLTIIVGSLISYLNNEKVSMDLESAKRLNNLIKNGCKVYTNSKLFYHGKIYYFETDEHAIVISGSSNMSHKAFYCNQEFDLISYLDKENSFLTFLNQQIAEQNLIGFLDESYFNISTPNDFPTISHADETGLDEFKVQVNRVKNYELRERLLLWIAHSPSKVISNIDIGKNDYYAIVYDKLEMIVLECLDAGNSYFVFYDVTAEKLIGDIKGKTKKEIFKMSKMDVRGYHSRELMRMEEKIGSYFKY